jgi:hypothetical protein
LVKNHEVLAKEINEAMKNISSDDIKKYSEQIDKFDKSDLVQLNNLSNDLKDLLSNENETLSLVNGVFKKHKDW